MATVITRKWSAQALRFTTDGWQWAEVFTVTGVANQGFAIDAVRAAYPTHPNDARLFINTPSATNVGLNIFDVAAVYSFRARDGENDPLDRATVYRGSYELLTRVVDRDRLGRPIVNSAGFPFDPPPTETHTVFVLACERNIPAFDIASGMGYTGAVNSDSFVLPGAGTVDEGNCLCRMYGPISDWQYGDDYVRVRGEFLFDEGISPHDFKVVDKGRTGWWNDGGTKKIGTFVSETGDDPGVDVLLDGTGKPIRTEFKVRERTNTASAVADPVGPPAVPSGLVQDGDLTGPDQITLIWETKKRANFSGLPF